MSERLKVTFVGVGALGSHALSFCRNIFREDHDVRIIDFDDVEIKNVWSQEYGTQDVSRPKVQACHRNAYSRYQVLIGGADVLRVRLQKDNVHELLKGASLVVDTTDNYETRKLINEHCRERGTPCIHAAMAGGQEFGLIRWAEDFTPEEADGDETCDDPDMLHFITRFSSILAKTITRYVREGKKLSWVVGPASLILEKK